MNMRNDLIEFLLDNKFNIEIIKNALQAKKYKRLTESPFKNNKNIKYDKLIDIDLCKTLHKEFKLPIYKIAMLYGVSDSGLGMYLFKHNFIANGHKCGINSNNDYFRNIDSYDKAYFLGLLAADGSIVYSKNKSKASITLSLTQSDSYILEKFNIYAKLNAKIKISHPEDEIPRKYISINSINMANDLEQYGIVQNKSKKDSIHIPNIKEEFIPHFIRGFFDGDGIAYSYGAIGFCGSKKIIAQIKNFLRKALNIADNKVVYNKSNHIYYISWFKKEDVLAIASLLYKNCNDLYLTRKKVKIFNRFNRPGI